MNKDIKTWKAPKSIIRVDKWKIKWEQDHVHFEDGSALNVDWTWKHWWKRLTNEEKKWLEKNWWILPN